MQLRHVVWWLPALSTVCGAFSAKDSRPKRTILGIPFGRLSMTDSKELASPHLIPDGGLNPCVIKVIGVGGGGCNAIDRMLTDGTGISIAGGGGLEFWAINTDAQALARSKSKGANVLNIGMTTTKGLGAGGDPEVGRMAAVEDRVEIENMISGADMCFITAGLGGGTGSGAAPVIAEIAKDAGALTIGVATKPFTFEGKRRTKQAEEAEERLRKVSDATIVISNDKLLDVIPDDFPLQDAFLVADEMLREGIVGISELVVKPGLINVDFADVKTIMRDAGSAIMGIGSGTGKNAAEEAALEAISSPLLDSPIENAKGVVFNIRGGPGLSLTKVNAAANLIYAKLDSDANVIFGSAVDDKLGDEVVITLLAAGLSGGKKKRKREGLNGLIPPIRNAEPIQIAPSASSPSPSKSSKSTGFWARVLRRK
jgi:cell division protein FtsZ